MPYLRLTADRRGVEHTFLLHVPAPGVPPKVLYWYRTAPGLRIGRPALDDAAMRTIEEHHPEIDFDWPYIIDMGAMTPVEVEASLPPRKRRPKAAEDEEFSDEVAEPAAAGATGAAPVEVTAEGPDLLSELVGRGIATSLRARHADLRALIESSAGELAQKTAWRERLAAIDPDGWTSPEAVLVGMSSAEHDFEALREEVARASAE